MAALAGKVALVIGGCGEVGEGITRALLAAGAIVAVSSRDNERLSELHDRLPVEWDGQYVPIHGDCRLPYRRPGGARPGRVRVPPARHRRRVARRVVAEGAADLLEPRRLEPCARQQPDAALSGGDGARADDQQAAGQLLPVHHRRGS